ncbi:MAG: DUF3857 domain-containing protein [Bdellovibrionaceae bacterium]|nr:DUF3857 domain-containing protein [Pseudobdellovibrionaceae bacterium]
MAPWEDRSDYNALATLAALRLKEALLVVPVRFGEEEPPDLEALCRAFLNALNFDYPGENGYGRKPWDPGHGGEGVELRTSREIDGETFDYQLRIARGRRAAYLLAGWSAAAGSPTWFARSLDAITLQEPEGAAPGLSGAQQSELGLFYNRAALSYFSRGMYETAAHWFQRAFDQTGDDPVLLQNVGHALENAGDFAGGRSRMEAHYGQFSENFDYGTRLARLRVLGGDVAAGLELFLELIEKGLKDEDELLAWLRLLNGGKHHEEALRSVQTWLARQPSLTVKRWQAQVLFSANRTAESLQQLEALLQENPQDMRVAFDLGGISQSIGKPRPGAEVVEPFLAGGNESTRALMILGESQMGRKHYREAKATFERASGVDPADEEIQDAVRRASALLGEGNNSGIRDPLDPVNIPEAVASALAVQQGRMPEDFAAGHPSVALLRATGWHFESGKPLRKTLHRRTQVLTPEGAQEYSTLEFPFDPLAERIYMNRVEVKDEDGRTIGVARVEDAYVRDEAGAEASHDKILHIQVPGVQPGCTVEWEVTIEDRVADEHFPFQRHLFNKVTPWPRKRYLSRGR